MPKFDYQAVDATGARASGQIEAADATAAREQLLARDLTIVVVRSSEPSVSQGRATVSSSEGLELTTRLAELTSAELPLGPALKALAVEMPPGRLATAFTRLGDHLDRGVALESAINMPDVRLPAHLRGILSCGAGAGKLAIVLEQFLQHQQLSYELRRRMWTAIAYPMTLVAALALWCWFILAAIVPGMARVFDDFGIQLPSMTASVIWLSVHRFALFFSLPLVFGCAVALIFLVGGRASLSNLFAAAPLFGPLWRDRGLAEFSSLLALLLEHSVPLPAALRTTANGLRDAGVAEASRRSAQSASEGQSLGDSLVGEPGLSLGVDADRGLGRATFVVAGSFALGGRNVSCSRGASPAVSRHGVAAIYFCVRRRNAELCGHRVVHAADQVDSNFIEIKGAEWNCSERSPFFC
jgi:type II secretory pathway component PulF